MPRPFAPNAHHLRHWTKAAWSGLRPAPESRSRGARPHLLRSFTTRFSSLAPPFLVSLQHTEAEEVLFVDGVEHHGARTLDDLVFQSRDCQRPLSPIGLRYVRPAQWMGPTPSPVRSAVEILEVALEVHFVVLPRHPVDPSGSPAFERVEGCPERFGVDMVEKRGEPLLLPLPCGLPYAVQRLGHAHPVLSPVRALLTRVPLGPCPLLRHLRRRWPGFVR